MSSKNRESTMKITTIKIARLHNLGNYEHVRYELSAEIGPSESATQCVIGLENILNDLDPKPPADVKSSSELSQGKLRLERITSLPPEEFDTEFGFDRGDRDDYIKRLEEDMANAIQKRLEWEKRRETALQMLDNIGGTTKWTDCKQQWEDY
jgi:hypothetical protein